MAPSRSQRRKLFILSSLADGISANKVIKNGVVKGVNVEEAASLGKISREVLKKTLPLLRIMWNQMYQLCQVLHFSQGHVQCLKNNALSSRH